MNKEETYKLKVRCRNCRRSHILELPNNSKWENGCSDGFGDDSGWWKDGENEKNFQSIKCPTCGLHKTLFRCPDEEQEKLDEVWVSEGIQLTIDPENKSRIQVNGQWYEIYTRTDKQSATASLVPVK